ncbi:MFS transporter [Nocardioides nitrophenolicus]|uniref:MFS transporter n=1 Tax=Nocardioides nitrophenolicus TaxID=60489 RepID=UPI00195888DA|nr:MFS transporter [Nocardioides nitrophenolicus]MBM7516505.1 CP family cyanate transporter-like MFS transporter [Nocardioides nitrophenolicus]
MSSPAVPTPSPARSPATVRRPGALPAWLIVLLVTVVGLNLRASLGSFPPLLDDMAGDLPLSNTAAGLLTSVAVVFMGLCAPVGQRLGTRVGAEMAVGLMMQVLALAGIMRIVAWGGLPLLFVSVALAGAAMGGISSLMPALIAHHVPRIRGLTVGLYSTGLASGVAIAAAVAVPWEHLLGGWRASVAAWGFIAAATGALWLLAVPRLRASTEGAPAATVVVDHRMPLRSRTAWWVTAFTTGNMIVGFSGLAWVTPLYASLGKSPHEAASMLVLFQIVQLLAMLTLPAITDFTTDRRPMLALMVLATCAGIALLLLDPITWAVPAVVLFGIGVGGGSTLGLVLIVDCTDSQADAARLGAMTLLIAFLAGALGPFVLGLLRDLSGGFTAGYAVMLALAGAMLAVVFRFRPGRTIHDA